MGHHSNNPGPLISTLHEAIEKIRTYVKDNNEFLKKLLSLSNLLDDIKLCTVNVVGLYPNIPHDKGLSALRKRLNLKQGKDVTTSTLVELDEVVLRIIFLLLRKKLYS